MKKDAFILTGKVEAVLVAHVFGDHVSRPQKKISVVRGTGVRGDSHAGARLVDAREHALLDFGFAKGAEIANVREFSMVSVEELAEIAANMGLPNTVPFGCLGENVVVSGIPHLTQLPPGTLVCFRKNADQRRTAVLAVWGENKPCLAPGEAIQRHYAQIPKLAGKFPKAAMGKRGVVGLVYSSGTIHTGDEVVAHVPAQQLYEP